MIKFISYGKALSVICVVLIHFMTAFFNTTEWNYCVNIPLFVNAGGYLRPILKAERFTSPAIWGFVVVGAVCFFFLASGFTVVGSLRKRSFVDFCVNKITRFLPFYTLMIVFDMAIAKLASVLYGEPFHHSIMTMLLQLLMGMQFYLPDVPVLDPVVWFLGVLWLFYLFAAIFLRRVTVTNIIIFDLANVACIYICRFLFKHLHVAFFVQGNYSFIIKALVFNIFIGIAVICALHFRQEISGKKCAVMVALQYLLFLAMYSKHLETIAYVDRMYFISWFTCYVLIFLLGYMCNSKMGECKVLSFFDKISFPLYFCHGFMGFFMFTVFSSFGAPKFISLIIALPIVVMEAYLLNKYVMPLTVRLLK